MSYYIGLAELLGHGKVNNYEFLVMPMYGRTLKEALLCEQTAEKRKFNLLTVCQIGLQLVNYTPE